MSAAANDSLGPDPAFVVKGGRGMTREDGQPSHCADSGRQVSDARWTLFTSLTAQIAAPPAGAQQGRYLSFTDFSAAAFVPAVHLSEGLTFLFRTLLADRLVAWYPCDKGAVEVALPAGAWPTLVATNPGVEVLEPVSEALLIRRTSPATDALTCLLLPSWTCFEIIVSPSSGRHVAFMRGRAEAAMQELWTRAETITHGPVPVQLTQVRQGGDAG
jgi:hypothetical protein